MTLLQRLIRRVPAASPSAAQLALDIGTEYAKALVFEHTDDGAALVTGVGRRRQGLSHMQSGTVADIPAVVRNCRAALDEAEAMAGRAPAKVIIGIAGELVKGFTTTRSIERKRPDNSVTHSELERLLEEIEAEASAEAQRTITWETGLPNVDVRLVHAAVASAGIDGYAVSNPVGFQGRHLRISVFNAYAPLVHLGALESVVEGLGLDLIKVVAEPYAVARSVSGEQVGQSGALFIDVGGGTTDVALVRSGSVEGTRMFALGGRAFTKSLADRLDLDFDAAEQVKLAHSAGAEEDEADEVAAIIGEDVAVWAAGVELVLEEFGQGGLLPGRIELCGGGAALPEIRAALEARAFGTELPFARRPLVSMMQPDSVSEVIDATGLLVDQQDVTPMALAFQAVEAALPQEPLDAALRRVLRGMRI
ncbi:MAG TPA: cell division FtsA domain-containing protein [Anaerolineae bacterium]|nr:cell division FtsA domain-containing protein [Anaerolineae bacterium]